MYLKFNKVARDMILAFMHHYFPDREQLVRPYKPLGVDTNVNDF